MHGFDGLCLGSCKVSVKRFVEEWGVSACSCEQCAESYVAMVYTCFVVIVKFGCDSLWVHHLFVPCSAMVSAERRRRQAEVWQKEEEAKQGRQVHQEVQHQAHVFAHRQVEESEAKVAGMPQEKMDQLAMCQAELQKVKDELQALRDNRMHNPNANALAGHHPNAKPFFSGVPDYICGFNRGLLACETHKRQALEYEMSELRRQAMERDKRYKSKSQKSTKHQSSFEARKYNGERKRRRRREGVWDDIR